MASKGLELPQTRGTFQVRGKVVGTTRDNFYSEKQTKTNKEFRMVNFGVEFDEGSTMYLSLNGMEKDFVYFSNEDKKTEKVAWKDRFTQSKNLKLIGIHLGVKKVLDEKGNQVNDKKVMTEFDACKEIAENLKDGMPVFVRGNIEYSTYEGKHSTKFIPTQISLGKEIDFDAIDFKPIAEFTQSIVFMGITPNEDKTKASVLAKIVNYNTIEDTEFVVTDMNLAKVFNKNLKPYTSIKVWGDISITKDTSEVSTSDCWGSANNMDRINSPTIRELIITGASPETIDKNTYSEKEIDKAIETIKTNQNAVQDFGKSNTNDDSWGNVSTQDEEDTGW